MKISADILVFLKLYKKASVPNFGWFSVVKTGAIFDSTTQTLLPPSQQIDFEKKPIQSDEGLIQFIAKRNHTTAQIAEEELNRQVGIWNDALAQNKSLTLDELGFFSLENQTIHFQGARILAENSDFFGLDEINLENIKKTSSYRGLKVKKSSSSSFNSVVLWTFLVVIPIAGLVFLAIIQQDLLFGKKSFGNVSIQNSTHRIEKPIAKDSTLIIISADSLTIKTPSIDSLNQTKSPIHGK